jgi:predicted ATPase
LARMRACLVHARAIDHPLSIVMAHNFAATIAADLGRRDEALETVAEALALSERTGLRYWDAELHRLRGTFLAGVDAAAADASFSEALTIARAQQARSLELRAAMSRARLWSGRRRDAEARALLADVVGWFREGFETADLVDATTLLPGAVTRRKRR